MWLTSYLPSNSENRIRGRLAEHVDEHVEAAAMRHADDDLLDALDAAALDQVVEQRDESCRRLRARSASGRRTWCAGSARGLRPRVSCQRMFALLLGAETLQRRARPGSGPAATGALRSPTRARTRRRWCRRRCVELREDVAQLQEPRRSPRVRLPVKNSVSRSASLRPKYSRSSTRGRGRRMRPSGSSCATRWPRLI